MFKFIISFLCFNIFLSCNQVVNSDELTQNQELHSNLHREHYSNGKLKIEGALNQQGKKTGKWTAFHENGVLLSQAIFVDGKNDGFSVVYYPSGKLRYKGDYKKGIKVGIWQFYNELGQVTKEQKY